MRESLTGLSSLGDSWNFMWFPKCPWSTRRSTLPKSKKQIHRHQRTSMPSPLIDAATFFMRFIKQNVLPEIVSCIGIIKFLTNQITDYNQKTQSTPLRSPACNLHGACDRNVIDKGLIRPALLLSVTGCIISSHMHSEITVQRLTESYLQLPRQI